MNEHPFDKKIREAFIVAMMTAPSLAVLLISAAYQLMLSEATGSVRSVQSVTLGIISLVAVAASLTLAAVYRKTSVAVAFASVLGLGFLCYLIFTVCGTTNIADDTFFEASMLVFSLPLMSFMSIGSTFGIDKNVALLLISGTVTVISSAVAVYAKIMNSKEQTASEEKAETEKPHSSRRKIR